MSDLLLSIDNDDINNNNKSSNPVSSPNERTEEEEKQKQVQQQINCLSELRLTENDSFFAILKRLCFYWRRALLQKIRVVLALLFMSMLNLTTRITCFTRRRTPSSSSSFNTSVSSSSIRILEEDLKSSSKSPLLIENSPQQHLELLSLENPTMANILIQQKTHRTPNININRSTTSQNDTSLLVRHSVDDRIFFHDPTRLLHFITRFASEPQISKYNSQSTNSNGLVNKPLKSCTITFPVSNTCTQYNQSDNDELHFDEIFILNCDKIQPASTFNIDDFTSDKVDNIISTTTNVPEEIITINETLPLTNLNGDFVISEPNDELKPSELNEDSKILQLNEDILIETNSPLNEGDAPGERHFRRRKRRSSLTRNSLSLDEAQPTTDLIEKVNVNTTDIKANIEPAQNPVETLKLTENDDKENKNIIEQESLDNKAPTQANDDAEKSAPLSSRYRGRRLRHRFYRQAAEKSSSSEISNNGSAEFYITDKALNIETSPIFKPNVSLTVNTLSVPTSPTAPLHKSLSNPTPGGLKRNGSSSSKKTVRFADSVGRELAQVQYIDSATNDESSEFSFLLGSSLLSSSPPSFTKANLYLPAASFLEHKPWSFDVISKPTKQSVDKPAIRRFYCLFRQPDTEHPDIFLHEVWKSQIKLDHADIPLQLTSSGEQQLHGSIWVTNAGFQKYVSVKYTFNNWLNSYEHEAQYSHNSNDFRNLDQFKFTIDLPKDVDRIDFVLRYCVNGQEYWDNNLGKNYIIQADSAYITSTAISLPHDCDFNEMRFY